MLSNSDFVRCVGGDIAVDAVGHAQCHEHIWMEKGASFRVNPALCLNEYDKSLAELVLYREAGGNTIVDSQPGGFGRNIDVLRRLSEESGVNIVSVSGAHKLCFLDEPSRFDGKDERTLAKAFISELTGGDIRTGMLKLALDTGGIGDARYSVIYAGVLRAAAETGAPLMIHTEKGNDMAALLQRCADYGIKPERVMICHLDRTDTAAETHAFVLDEGCFLCYDSVHRYKYVSDEQELALIRAMIGRGHQGQLLLALDSTNQRLKSYNSPDMSLAEILTGFIPKVRATGISEAAISAMCRENAKRILQYN